jgi:predicted metalloprotease with PDZ domain
VRHAHRLLVLFLLLAVPGWSQAQPAGVHYTLSLADREHHVLHVILRPISTPDLKVQLPVWNATYLVRDFAQYVLWVKARDAAGHLLPVRKQDKTTWSVPNAAEVEYAIGAEVAGPYGAQLNREHGFFNFALVLMYPVGQRGQPMTVTFQDVPGDWHVATALASAGPASFRAENYDRLVDSPLEMGEFQETSFREGGATYSIAVDADPADYDMNALAEMARRIVTTEVAWMDDRPFDRYLFLYHFPRTPSGGGMEHAYSTAIDASAVGLKEDPGALASVTAHEFFHLWNVKRIRPQSLEPVDYTRENYTRALWFSEGVTSTVTGYILVRAGLLSPKNYLQSLAGQIRTLENRPARLTQSAEESSLDTWFDKYPYYVQPERSINYYNKGEILGVLLDLELREATGGSRSLRDLFHWMNGHFAKRGRFFPDSAGVEEAAQAVSGHDFSQFFHSYVAGGEPLPYDRDFATVGLKLERRKVTVPDTGFRVSTPVHGQPVAPVVVAVDPGSEAERAGLLPGDIIREVNGKLLVEPLEALLARMKVGDTIELKVRGRRTERKLSFKLGGREEDDFALVDIEHVTAAQRARRAAWLSGEPDAPARP